MAFEFQNSLHWDLVIRQTYTVRIVAADPEGRWEEYRRIPDITLLVDSPILAIGIRNPKAKPWWKWGATASMRLPISPSSTSEFLGLMEGDRYFCRLEGLTLVRFPVLDVPQYILSLEIPYWFEEVFIEVWKYSGPTDDVEVEINLENPN